LGALVLGRTAARRHGEERILVNPFGLGIEDVIVADAVHRRASELGLGVELA
jgi:ornithine cyclodeaminase/alanine dehydrogenase-like protein (mu-crystallin family)